MYLTIPLDNPSRVRVSARPTRYSDPADAVAAAATAYLDGPGHPRTRLPGLWVVALTEPGQHPCYRIVTAEVNGNPLPAEDARRVVRDAFAAWEARKRRAGTLLGRSWLLRFPDLSPAAR